MLSGKRELTFSTCFQTSASFPLFIQHLLEAKVLDYILTGSIQSEPLEKRFGRYCQFSDGNYFDFEKQFLDAKKSNVEKESNISSNYFFSIQ